MKYLVTFSQLPILGGDPKLKFLVDIEEHPEHPAMNKRPVYLHNLLLLFTMTSPNYFKIVNQTVCIEEIY